jgi:hypothetical protein
LEDPVEPRLSPVDVREPLSVGDFRSSVAREERCNFKFELEARGGIADGWERGSEVATKSC